LALNIKADGLQIKLKNALINYYINNYFIFDMSIPDHISYIKDNYDFNIFTRQSEYEEEPALYEKSAGVWLDEFNGHWINKKTIVQHLDNNKKVCIVSPELHNRDYKNVWVEIKKYNLEDKIMICTDYPEEAERYFHEKNKSSHI
jgi:hypothetical protein